MTHAEYLARLISSGKSHLRLGDGELAAVNQERGGNCDGVAYTPKLAKHLSALETRTPSHVWAFPYQDLSSYKAAWPRITFTGNEHFEALHLMNKNEPNRALLWFYRRLWAVRHRTVLVGPAHLAFYGNHCARHIIVPNVLTDPPTVSGISKDQICVIAGGPWCKGLAFNLAHNNQVLDIGSALDPVALPKPTRSGQLTHAEATDWWEAVCA